MSDNIRPSPILRLWRVLRGQSERTCGQVPAEEEDAEAAAEPRRRKHVRRRMEEQSDGESGHRDAREDPAAEGDERREDDAEGDEGREDEKDPVPNAHLQGPGEAVLPRAVREEGLRQGVRAVVQDLAQLEGDEEEGGGRRVEEIQHEGWAAQVRNRIPKSGEPIADGEAIGSPLLGMRFRTCAAQPSCCISSTRRPPPSSSSPSSWARS